MKTRPVLLLVSFLLVSLLRAASAAESDLTGRWRSEFDTQIGVQKYVFELKQDGEKLTGTADAEIDGGKYHTVLTEGSVTAEGNIIFVELLKFQGFDLRIVYRGQLVNDELQLTRDVADVAQEKLVARRIQPEDESKS